MLLIITPDWLPIPVSYDRDDADDGGDDWPTVSDAKTVIPDRSLVAVFFVTPTFISSSEEDMNAMANVVFYHRHLTDATSGLQTTSKYSASLETLSAEFQKTERKINKVN